MAMVTVLAAPAKTRWATPARAALRLGLPSDADTLSLLGELLDEQADTAAGVVGRPVARARYLELVPGRGDQFLKLSRGPVETVNSVRLRGELVDPTGYYVADAARGLIGRTRDAFPRDSWELTADYVGRSERIPLGGDPRPDYEVDFVAGYVMPEDDQALCTPPAPGVALPDRLRGVAMVMLREAWFERRRDPGVHVYKKADRQVNFFGPAGAAGRTAPNPYATQLPGNCLSVLLDEGDLL